VIRLPLGEKITRLDGFIDNRRQSRLRGFHHGKRALWEGPEGQWNRKEGGEVLISKEKGKGSLKRSRAGKEKS